MAFATPPPARSTTSSPTGTAARPPFTNGRAVCVRSNQVREMPGWAVRLVHDGTGTHPHSVVTTTPTGHTHTSRAGPAP